MANPTKSELAAKLDEIKSTLLECSDPEVVAVTKIVLPRIEKEIQGLVRVGGSSLGLALALLTTAQNLISNNIALTE